MIASCLVCAITVASGPTIVRLSPTVVYVALGGSKPELNATTCSFSVFGHGFRRGDRCMYNGDEVPTRFRSSRRLDVTVSVEEVLKRTGQADGAAVIKVWDPRARLVSNPAGLVSEFQPLGG